MSVALHVRDRFVAAQLAGDRGAALRVLEDAAREGRSASELILDVVQAAQYEIGRRWEADEITVAHEHAATAIAELALAHIYLRFPRRPPNGRSILAACVQGETHQLGLRVVSDLLELEGFDIRYMGGDLPTEDIVAIAEELGPDLVALSVTMTGNLPTARKTVARLRERAPDIWVVVGGQAFRGRPDEVSALGTRVFASHASAAVEQARRLLQVA